MAHVFSFQWIRIAAVGAVMALAVSPVRAQVVCGGHSDLVAGLAQAFQEKQVGYGVVGQKAVIEIYVSESGTWTMLITGVKDRSCILATGDGWENTLAVAATAHGL